MNYLQKKKLAFMSLLNGVKGFVRTVFGTPPLTLPDCMDDKSVIDYSIYGNTIDNVSVGVYEEAGEYEIPTAGRGKNVFELGSPNNYYNPNGMNLTISENSITAVIGSGASTYIYNTIYNYKPGKYYLSHSDKRDIRFLVRCYNEEGTQLTNANMTLKNMSYNSYYKGWFINTTSGVNVTIPDTVSFWQFGFVFVGGVVGKSCTYTDLEVYKFYSYKIPIIAKGKNLFDKAYWSSLTWSEIENMRTLINVSDTTQVTVIPLGIGKGTYTFSVENAPTTGGYYYGLYDILDGKFISRVRIYNSPNWVSPLTITVTGELYIGSWFGSSSLSGQPVRAITELRDTSATTQIEEGATATECEPYIEPITTNIYIEEPLADGESICYSEDGLPLLPTFKGTTIYGVDTTVQPSNMEVTYYSTQKGE